MYFCAVYFLMSTCAAVVGVLPCRRVAMCSSRVVRFDGGEEEDQHHREKTGEPVVSQTVANEVALERVVL